LNRSVTCVRIVVHGHVQGVGFRFAACEAASDCSVTGWVRNLRDGSVEIVAEGTADAVARMTAWAHRGPRHASVDLVQVESFAVSSKPVAFEILR
jgi:acylphosphatase